MARLNKKYADGPVVEITRNVLEMSPQQRDRMAIELIQDLRAIRANARVLEGETVEDGPKAAQE